MRGRDEAAIDSKSGRASQFRAENAQEVFANATRWNCASFGRADDARASRRGGLWNLSAAKDHAVSLKCRWLNAEIRFSAEADIACSKGWLDIFRLDTDHAMRLRLFGINADRVASAAEAIALIRG